ncbi:hypothetical protein B0H13DRAFT_1878570 [Mycena leptocephala]|nr:hypothetical protein B0H13DRAFT_1878570 [Mycena leptocephala]
MFAPLHIRSLRETKVRKMPAVRGTTKGREMSSTQEEDVDRMLRDILHYVKSIDQRLLKLEKNRVHVSSGAKKPRNKNSGNRAPSAYNIFVAETLPKWKKNHPESSGKEPMAAVNALWRKYKEKQASKNTTVKGAIIVAPRPKAKGKPAQVRKNNRSEHTVTRKGISRTKADGKESGDGDENADMHDEEAEVGDEIGEDEDSEGGDEDAKGEDEDAEGEDEDAEGEDEDG